MRTIKRAEPLYLVWTCEKCGSEIESSTYEGECVNHSFGGHPRHQLLITNCPECKHTNRLPKEDFNSRGKIFNVGDLVILNYAEAPTGWLIVIVTEVTKGGYYNKYVSVREDLESFNEENEGKGMFSKLERATLVEDFGVTPMFNGEFYWVEDGKTLH